jgi:hypothetical protein
VKIEANCPSPESLVANEDLVGKDGVARNANVSHAQENPNCHHFEKGYSDYAKESYSWKAYSKAQA